MHKAFRQFASNPRTIFIAALAVSILVQTQGYCDPAEAKIESVTASVKKLLFGSTIRKAALTIGAGAGLFQAFMAGSIRPLLIWGGLGLCICYFPVFIDWIGGIEIPT